MVKNNIEKIRDIIKKAASRAGRSPDAVRLICVTKEANSSEILDALSHGITELGENRIKDALLKYKAIGDNAVWHLVGHLQTNKVKDAVRVFSVIHSVDSVKLGQRIDKEAKKAEKIQEALIEVNISGEETKFGVLPSKLEEVIKSFKGLNNIRIIGLMTVTPFTDNAEKSRIYFRTLKELANKYGLKELSMGMTQDYEVAVEEGATMVRIGRGIFGG